MTPARLIGTAVLVSASALNARRVDAQQLASAASFDAGTKAAVEQIAERAAARGLPPEQVVVKARFAALMRAPGPKIVAVAEAVARRLELARDALAPAPTPGDIKAGEDALSAGVTPDALRLVRAVRPDRSVAVPLGLLAQLVATGVPVPRASRIVTDLMRRGAGNQQLVALGNDVNTDIALGARADASLDLRTQALTAVLGAGGDNGSAAAVETTPNDPGGVHIMSAGSTPGTRTGRPRRP